MSTVDTTPNPRVHIDWGGDHVTMLISIGNVEIRLSLSHERGEDMIRELQWATREIARFKNHFGSPDLFVQKPHPDEAPSRDLATIRDQLDQLWGWAKSGKERHPGDAGEYYLMDVENVDSFTDNVLKIFSAEEVQ